MSDPFHTLDGTLNQVWQRLGRGVADRKSPARHLILSTVTPDGTPDARIVILRSADRTKAQLAAYTDKRSHKIKQLQANPVAHLLVWDNKVDLQIRIKALCSVTCGAEIMPLWQQIPDPARRVYGGHPSPGLLLAFPEDFDERPDPAAFAVLTFSITEVETLHLGNPLHRRARFAAADNWTGQWLAP